MSLNLNSSLTVLIAAVMALSLSACGAGNDVDPVVDLQASTAGVAVQPTNTTVAPSVTAVSANTPAPDCAPENCSSLRIIDGNAEAWRADAAKRDARADAGFAE